MYSKISVAALVANVSAAQLKNWDAARELVYTIEEESVIQADSWARINNQTEAWRQAYENRPADGEEQYDGGDDDYYKDEEVNWITQQPLNQTCDGSLQRLYNEAQGSIKVEGELFEDISFPANGDSITPGSTHETWRRPTEVDEQPSLYGEQGVRPAAIRQGAVGDCWLLASIAAIGEWPERVQKLFRGITEYPTNGQFELDFWAFGHPAKVTIDDRLPGSIHYGKFYERFTKKSRNGAWWATIVEKAAAKYYGTYSQMNGGWMNEALWALTGMPTIGFSSNSLEEDALWQRISDYNDKNYIMTSAVTGKKNETYNIVGGHAYTVIGTAEYANRKLVKVRNPWGSERYTGPWSDADTVNMTAEAKSALNHTNANDGSYFMDIFDYKRLMSSTVVGMYQDWQISTTNSVWNRSESIRGQSFKFENPVDQSVVITLSGAQNRQFGRDCAESVKLTDVAWSLCKTE